MLNLYKYHFLYYILLNFFTFQMETVVSVILKFVFFSVS